MVGLRVGCESAFRAGRRQPGQGWQPISWLGHSEYEKSPQPRKAEPLSRSALRRLPVQRDASPTMLTNCAEFGRLHVAPPSYGVVWPEKSR